MRAPLSTPLDPPASATCYGVGMKPLDPPKPLSHGESLAYDVGLRRTAREVTARAPRYPGAAERRSVQQLILDLTNNGLEICEFMLQALRGAVRAPGEAGDAGETIHVETKDRIAAARWLADRAWGKAPETVQVEDRRDPTTLLVDPRKLSTEALEEIEATISKTEH